MTLPPLARNPLFLSVGAALALALVAALAWRYTPLADAVTAEGVIEWIEGFARSWWAPYAVALLYTPASFVMFPRPLLTMGAAVAFGPVEGFAVAMGGIVVNALVGYGLGRTLDAKVLRRLGGAKLERVGSAIRKDGFVAVATVGLLPVAPFVIECMAFGTLRLKLRHVIPGVILANLPGTVASTLLGDQVAAALAHDRAINRWIIAGVVAFMAAVAWFTRRWWKRMQAA